MAEELQVLVEQEVGVISWNFEQLKTALAEKMEEYEGLVYTEDTVKVAKSDIAGLRKLKKEISDRRIEIKNKCLEPYGIIEAQAAELTELIDRPINQIDEQLAEYETKRKEEVRNNILKSFDDYGKDFPADILDTVKKLKYDPKWENVSVAAKRRKQGVEDACRAVARDLSWIDETVEEEFKEAALSVFKKTLALTDVMTEVTKLRRAKEAIIAKERERIAAEERAKAEAEAKAKMEAEMKVKAESNVPGQQAVSINQNTVLEARLGTNSAPNNAEGINTNPIPQNNVNGANMNAKNSDAEIYTIRVKATPEQWNRIKGYISHCGAIYREV